MSVFPIPRTQVSDVIVLSVGHITLLGGTVTALSNLSAGFGLLTTTVSVLWLAGYFGLWYLNIRWDGGATITATHFLERFSSLRAIRVLQGPDGPRLWYGFNLLGQAVTVLELKASGIRELTWSPGQASCMTNTDMDDWLVFLKVRSRDVITFRRRRFPNDGDESFLLSESLARKGAERKATDLQRFLNDKGLSVQVTPPKPDFITKLHRIGQENSKRFSN